MLALACNPTFKDFYKFLEAGYILGEFLDR